MLPVSLECPLKDEDRQNKTRTQQEQLQRNRQHYTQDKRGRQTNKKTQHRDTVNIGYTRHRIKTNCFSLVSCVCFVCFALVSCVCFVCFRLVSCVPNVASVSGLTLLIAYSNAKLTLEKPKGNQE
jgi:hypothetical protein